MKDLELRILLNEKLCDIADALFLRYDCCQIKPGEKPDEYMCRDGFPNECNACRGTRFSNEFTVCPFQRDHKCNFRNIECRAWICKKAKAECDPKCVEALELIEKIAVIFGLIQ
jgi:hypothetical protein